VVTGRLGAVSTAASVTLHIPGATRCRRTRSHADGCRHTRRRPAAHWPLTWTTDDFWQTSSPQHCASRWHVWPSAMHVTQTPGCTHTHTHTRAKYHRLKAGSHLMRYGAARQRNAYGVNELSDRCRLHQHTHSLDAHITIRYDLRVHSPLNRRRQPLSFKSQSAAKLTAIRLSRR